MSREIKFRAWVTSGLDSGYMHNFDMSSDGYPRFQWDRVVLEQYTGLKDKNGKEIYEGDVVFFFTEHFDKATGGFDGEDEHNAIVEWFDNGFAFMDKVPYDPNIECEVIGNIHENPELLDDSIHGPYGPIGEENIGGESRRMKNENLGKN